MFLAASNLQHIKGVCHGFGTRLLGDVSIASNQEAMVDALPMPSKHQKRLVTAKQVHQTHMIEARIDTDMATQADALWSSDPHIVAAVMVADCVPILIADKSGRFVAAVHAGWRGTCEHICLSVIKTLSLQTGMAPTDWVVAIGPSIGPCCFAVQADVFERLQQSYASVHALHTQAFVQRDAGLYVDLQMLNKAACLAAGVPETAIEVLHHCTYCRADLFFSYRRDHGTTGRQAALIACAA